MNLEELKDKHYGERGTKNREQLEDGYKAFKIGVMLKEARKKSGLTQHAYYHVKCTINYHAKCTINYH